MNLFTRPVDSSINASASKIDLGFATGKNIKELVRNKK